MNEPGEQDHRLDHWRHFDISCIYLPESKCSRTERKFRQSSSAHSNYLKGTMPKQKDQHSNAEKDFLKRFHINKNAHFLLVVAERSGLFHETTKACKK